MKVQTVAHIKLFFAMVIGGSSYVAAKAIVDSVPIFLSSGLRYGIAAIILLMILIIKEGKLMFPNKSELKILLLQSIFGILLFNIFMLVGLKHTTAVASGVIVSSLPLTVAFLGVIFFRERITLNKGIGIFLAIAGVLFINIFDAKVGGSGNILGNILIFCSVLCEATFLVLGKSISSKLSPIVNTTYGCLIGFLLSIPFMAIELTNFSLQSITLQQWLIFIYMGIFVTVAGFLLMYQALPKVSTMDAGVFSSVMPLSTLILSLYFLNEKIYIWHFFSMICIFAAIFIQSINFNFLRRKSNSIIVERK